MRETLLIVALLVAVAAPAMAQGPERCRVLCAPEFSVEPTVTFTNLFGAPRIDQLTGTQSRSGRSVRPSSN